MADVDPGLARGNDMIERLRNVLAIDPTAPAIEFDHRWYTWGDIGVTVAEVAKAVEALSLPAGSEIGLLLRNRPASVGLLLGTLCAGGCVVVLNPALGAERVTADLSDLDVPLVVGQADDVDLTVTAAQRRRTSTLEVDDLGTAARFADASLHHPGEQREGVAVRMLTSGTTGPPKRIELAFDLLEGVLRGAKHYESGPKADLVLRRGVAVVNSPLVHLGGLFRVLQSVSDGRRMAMLERFTVESWVDLVRRHRPLTASLVPAALRMVLDADVDPDDLSSLRTVISGTAALDPDDADAFTRRYGVAVLTNYAATEFGGAVAGWTLRDHETYWADKRGSVGRAQPGCDLRVVDTATGSALPTGEVGLLEVRAGQLPGDEWIRTTDLARLDADGFLWIVGRADQTIVRGGMKVQPETVRLALERHPAVRAAAVVGVDDQRLGQVPVAVVELTEPGAADQDALLDHASAHLARYELPVEVLLVAALPRTAASKIDLVGVRDLLVTHRSGGEPG